MPPLPRPYIQRPPQCGVPHMAGSICRAFVQGCLPNASVPPPYRPEITRFTMVNRMQFYIDGAWVDPVVKKSTPVVNPATEEAMYEVALGSKADVDKAVAAAKRAFETFSQTSREERVALLDEDHRDLQGPHEGNRRRRLRRDGRAAADGGKAAGRRRPRPYRRHARRPQELSFRGDRSAPPWWCASRSASSA